MPGLEGVFDSVREPAGSPAGRFSQKNIYQGGFIVPTGMQRSPHLLFCTRNHEHNADSSIRYTPLHQPVIYILLEFLSISPYQSLFHQNRLK